jgi:hypothetical protein
MAAACGTASGRPRLGSRCPLQHSLDWPTDRQIERGGGKRGSTIKQRPPGQVQVDHAMARVPVRISQRIVRQHAQHLANLAALDAVAHLHAQREIPRPDSLHQEQALAPCNVNQRLGLRGVDGEGLFAEHMLVADLERETHVLVVVRVRRGHVDDVDVGVAHELLVAAVGRGLAGELQLRYEVRRARGRRRRCDGGHGVRDIVGAAGVRVLEEVADEGCACYEHVFMYCVKGRERLTLGNASGS